MTKYIIPMMLLGFALSSFADPPTILEIGVDIKPGDDPNDVNPESKGNIPVAILTTEDFDAHLVDPLTVQFGPGAATEFHERWHVEDVDEDGDLDLLFHFKTQETGIACGDSEAELVGETYSGQAIVGTDSITTVGCETLCPCAQTYSQAIDAYTIAGGGLSDGWDVCAGTGVSPDVTFSSDVTPETPSTQLSLMLVSGNIAEVFECTAATVRFEFGVGPVFFFFYHEPIRPITAEESSACIALQASLCEEP